MKNRHWFVCSALVALFLAGCDNSSRNNAVVPPPPPPPPAPTDFTTFVKDQFATTSDSTDPVEVDDEDYAFQDDENPNAFDDLLQ